METQQANYTVRCIIIHKNQQIFKKATSVPACLKNYGNKNKLVRKILLFQTSINI